MSIDKFIDEMIDNYVVSQTITEAVRIKNSTVVRITLANGFQADCEMTPVIDENAPCEQTKNLPFREMKIDWSKKNCIACGIELNQKNKEETTDCGGDCLGCIKEITK